MNESIIKQDEIVNKEYYEGIKDIITCLIYLDTVSDLYNVINANIVFVLKTSKIISNFHLDAIIKKLFQNFYVKN